MKLHHLMDNKIGRAGGPIRLRHDVTSACAADAGKLDRLEVNANEPVCAHDSLTSPRSPYGDGKFAGHGHGHGHVATGRKGSPEGCGLAAEDSGISENSLSLTEELDAEKILDDITEREESVTDSEGSSGGSSGRDRAVSFGHEVFGGHECADRSRTIGQIRESLEEKVRRLRDEKAAVDEKIKLAQEEEELRVREKTRLRQQLVVHRKDRLKKMIADLRRKLEDQSSRLQATYTTLISLQRTIFRHRSFSYPKKQSLKDSSLEAPF